MFENLTAGPVCVVPEKPAWGKGDLIISLFSMDRAVFPAQADPELREDGWYYGPHKAAFFRRATLADCRKQLNLLNRRLAWVYEEIDHLAKCLEALESSTSRDGE